MSPTTAVDLRSKILGRVTEVVAGVSVSFQTRRNFCYRASFRRLDSLRTILQPRIFRKSSRSCTIDPMHIVLQRYNLFSRYLIARQKWTSYLLGQHESSLGDRSRDAFYVIFKQIRCVTTSDSQPRVEKHGLLQFSLDSEIST